MLRSVRLIVPTKTAPSTNRLIQRAEKEQAAVVRDDEFKVPPLNSAALSWDRYTNLTYALDVQHDQSAPPKATNVLLIREQWLIECLQHQSCVDPTSFAVPKEDAPFLCLSTPATRRPMAFVSQKQSQEMPETTSKAAADSLLLVKALTKRKEANGGKTSALPKTPQSSRKKAKTSVKSSTVKSNISGTGDVGSANHGSKLASKKRLVDSDDQSYSNDDNGDFDFDQSKVKVPKSASSKTRKENNSSHPDRKKPTPSKPWTELEDSILKGAYKWRDVGDERNANLILGSLQRTEKEIADRIKYLLRKDSDLSKRRSSIFIPKEEPGEQK
mmetsp:Transcript_16937/g.33058  ORF Transcript_16937/g.33058 Transcript_16937/m.33058 type:complete len:329 (-) Transcript_16937:142-1128(-)|eukprot:CAMPEP_0171555770 /NCGR_PEP_ID=MMETSP0960-20121227/10327_1 /TAXON_ID=87120 /ORGANISM="Aurantiochytrium limacinum, Strain ATCCMYA-1381" /LENGTH=328 /DNA_ID=CAMNT_0012105899 /DNA_START=154 /DNA_END=1140 /DNA_ORIENTATION=-